MVRRDPAGDHVERHICERKVLSVGELEADVADTLALDEAPRGGEHVGRQIGGDNLGDVRSESKCGMPAAGSDIQHPLVATQPGKLHYARQIRAFSVYCTLNIRFGAGAELRLDGRTLARRTYSTPRILVEGPRSKVEPDANQFRAYTT